MRHLTTPRLTRYIAQRPTPKQAAFLLLPHLEALFGGAVGPGKSSGLLMGALQYVDVPGYSAIIFRKSYAALALPGGLIPRSKEWLANTDAVWNANDMRWTFPTQPGAPPATLSFGYLKNDDSIYRYQSSEFHYLAFDEITELPSQNGYRFLFSRLRKNRDLGADVGVNVPLRVRAASNPIGPGFDWVKQRFLTERHPDRIYLPATLDDNPYVDREEYLRSLSHLDPVTLKKLLRGDWTAVGRGRHFKRAHFRIVDPLARPRRWRSIVRFWDFAATEPTKENPDPDWLCGVLMALDEDDSWWILDVRRTRTGPGGVEDFIKQTAREDGKRVDIVVEQEGGSQAKITVSYLARKVLPGWNLHAQTPVGDKVARAGAFASQVRHRNVFLIRGAWNGEYLDELEAFDEVNHDDQVDASSGAFNWLVARRPRPKHDPAAPVIR